MADNWSRYNLCDIATKARAAFVASTDPDVYSSNAYEKITMR